MNSISGITGISLPGVPPQLLPTIILATVVDGKGYRFEMYDSEENLEFRDSINWTDTDIVGRSSSIFAYRNSQATEFTINGFLKIDSAADIPSWDNNMKNLRAMRFPVRFDLGLGAPPIWQLEVYAPHSTSRVYGPIAVRINAVSWQFMKPYLASSSDPSNSAGVPAITKISIDLREVEDTIDGSQVTFKNELFNINKNESLSFNGRGAPYDVAGSKGNNSATSIGSMVTTALKKLI